VKNWFSAKSGPEGKHLISMLIHSDTVLEMLLLASRRVELLDLFIGSVTTFREPSAGATWSGADRGETSKLRGPRVVPNGDPGRDPGHDPEDEFDLNDRERWFLEELGTGRRQTARGVQERFGVSEKTAKRDLAYLKAAGRVEFVGTRRKGRYRLAKKLD
jgi:hypothetical protein